MQPCHAAGLFFAYFWILSEHFVPFATAAQLNLYPL
nr:MAG TPA: hypothetical protein [Caudoviricetes sp.]